MPVDYRHNARARVNRAAKAYRLADELEELGRIPTAEERSAVLRELGIRSASDETWAMAVEIFMERHP
jgi:hypothetical protein